jgi:two-component system LytT family sensor kinase
MACETLTMILVVAWAPTTDLGLDIVSKIGIPMILGRLHRLYRAAGTECRG